MPGLWGKIDFQCLFSKVNANKRTLTMRIITKTVLLLLLIWIIGVIGISDERMLGKQMTEHQETFALLFITTALLFGGLYYATFAPRAVLKIFVGHGYGIGGSTRLDYLRVSLVKYRKDPLVRRTL